MRRFLKGLMSQDRAIANARSACTECSRRRVQREEVALYLERHVGDTTVTFDATATGGGSAY